MSVFVVALVAALTFGFIQAGASPLAQRRPQASRSQKARVPPKPKVDYRKFSHTTHTVTQKLACNSCHKFPSKNWKEVRKGDEAFEDVTDFPEHFSCLNCHRAQFFARERPAPIICSNCHVKVTPRNTTRYLFPSLGDVTASTSPRRDFVPEFAVEFPHDKHMEVIGRNSPDFKRSRPALFLRASLQEKAAEESDPKNCVICHRTYQPQGNSAEEFVTKPPKDLGDAFWLKKGTFKTRPVSHAACSTCHNVEAGIEPAPSKCEACHKLPFSQNQHVDFDSRLPVAMNISDRITLGLWRRRQSSGVFNHEGGAHPGLSCTTCHNITTMNTADVATLKVPVKSCGGAEGCHLTANADEGGALNYEIDQRRAKPDFKCTKCHLAFGTQALPASHVEALTTPVVK